MNLSIISIEKISRNVLSEGVAEKGILIPSGNEYGANE